MKTKSLVLDATVTNMEMGTDRYGRTSAEVSLPDGRSLNHDF